MLAGRSTESETSRECQPAAESVQDELHCLSDVLDREERTPKPLPVLVLPSGFGCSNIMAMRIQRLLALIALLGCGELGTTARLPSELAARFQREGILRSADDLTFRYTEAPGRRRSRWENRRASIVVTPATILIHKNAKIGLEITPRTQRAVAVERSGNRIRLRAGTGQAEELWSFEPPDGDMTGWTRDLRAVVTRPNPQSSRTP